MPRRILLYQITHATSGAELSRHRTQQAAIDTWRTKFAHQPIEIYRLTGNTERALVVEGTWHS